MAGPSQVGSTPSWMYPTVTRAVTSPVPRPVATVVATPRESTTNQVLDWGSRASDYGASLLEEGALQARNALGSRWNSVGQLTTALDRMENFPAYASWMKRAGLVMSAGQVLTAQDPLRAGLKEGFKMGGTMIAAPLGPLGATIGGELIGGTYDQIFFEDMPLLHRNAMGIGHEVGTLADITREGMHGSWADRRARINDIGNAIAHVGDGQGFVREHLADGLAAGYEGVATIVAGADYAGESLMHAVGSLGNWLYNRDSGSGEALGGAIEFGPDDWYGCGGPNTGWIVPDRLDLPFGIDIDATPACLGHDMAWTPDASLNDKTRANVQLGIDIMRGGGPDRSWGEVAARGAMGFTYALATDAVALGEAAWNGASGLWDSAFGDDGGVPESLLATDMIDYGSMGSSDGISDNFFDASGDYDLFQNDAAGYERF